MATRLQDLPVDERIRLVEDIWDSIGAERDKLPLTAPQREELDRRLDEFELDRDPGELASRVLAEIRRTI